MRYCHHEKRMRQGELMQYTKYTPADAADGVQGQNDASQEQFEQNPSYKGILLKMEFEKYKQERTRLFPECIFSKIVRYTIFSYSYFMLYLVIFYTTIIMEKNNTLSLKNNEELKRFASLSVSDVLTLLKTGQKGLSSQEVQKRLKQYGINEVTHEKKRQWYLHLFLIAKDPLNILLLLLASLAYLTHDKEGSVIIFLMVLLSIFMRFFQEHRADLAAEKLKAMVSTRVQVVRNGKEKEVKVQCIVPGDVILLSAGDLIPADVRLISSTDLFVDQSLLTGESLPVQKDSTMVQDQSQQFLEAKNMCFMGTHVQNGSATAVVVATGIHTYLGTVAEKIVEQQTTTSFERWIKSFTFLMIRIMAVLVPLVFILNGVSKGNWFEAFLFAMAVAVGLTPEMLPMIMTINLGKGALDMSRKKVIVKRLESIQSFGSMDILCTDKTGTLTQNTIVLEKYCDVEGQDSNDVLKYAYINSFFQTGLKNILDKAILKHEKFPLARVKKIDEIPFDFNRRIMSVVVQEGARHLLITKGAPEEIFKRCTSYMSGSHLKKMNHHLLPRLQKNFDVLSSDGFRILAVSYATINEKKKKYSKDDEKNLTLVGYLAFFDPPKATAKETIVELERLGIEIKVLTGDNHLVTKKICEEVGLSIRGLVTGDEIEKMSDEELAKVSESANVFARISPLDKERIIRVLREQKHVVNYLGDGINDAPALRAADVGISVDTAADIAKESADIILLEKSLIVLKDGVLEGRKIFANIIKYIKMSASSNFGNMFSVLGASIFLPFLPLLPVQILLNNLLYDVSQTTLPSDTVDDEYLVRPQKWNVNYMKKFIFFMGPISSIFDYCTFAIMIFVFGAWTHPVLFQTGWFVESLLTQTLIIHVIRTNKIPFLQSRASLPVFITTIGVVLLGIWLPFSPYASSLGFVPLPTLYWGYIGAMLIIYVFLTQIVKGWFAKRFSM